jgi:hypothetical protein
MAKAKKGETKNFDVTSKPTRTFFSLGKKNGVATIVYLAIRPLHENLTFGQPVQVSGYLSYKLVYNYPNIVVGSVFMTLASKTEHTPFKLAVCNDKRELPPYFAPNFYLEKLGVVMLVSPDSSVLVIPTEVESPLIVKV